MAPGRMDQEGFAWPLARCAGGTPRMVLAIAASSVCLGKISLCVLPPADATATREGNAPKPSQQEQQSPRQPNSRSRAGTRFGSEWVGTIQAVCILPEIRGADLPLGMCLH